MRPPTLEPATPSAPSTGSRLELLIDEHAALLFRVAYAVLRQPEDAEDAVQDALLKVHRSGALKDVENERAFLARSVFNAALDRKARRREVQIDDAAELQLEDPRPGPDKAAAESDQRALLGAWIEALPGDLRQTLLLSAVEGLNSREAAEVLGIPEGTVRTRLLRARHLLRAQWENMQRRGRPEVAATERKTR